MIISHEFDDVKTSFHLTDHLIYIDFIVNVVNAKSMFGLGTRTTKCNVSLFKWLLAFGFVNFLFLSFNRGYVNRFLFQFRCTRLT